MVKYSQIFPQTIPPPKKIPNFGCGNIFKKRWTHSTPPPPPIKTEVNLSKPELSRMAKSPNSWGISWTRIAKVVVTPARKLFAKNIPYSSSIVIPFFRVVDPDQALEKKTGSGSDPREEEKSDQDPTSDSG